MKTQIVYSNEFSKHDSVGHPENAERLNAIMNDIKKSSFYKDIDIIEPEILPEDRLYSVHSDEMIQQVKEYSSIGDSWIDLDTYVSQFDFETARLAAGGLVQVCKNVIMEKVDNAFAVIRPPGHHATKNRSMGFCLFNNAALAANYISKNGKRVLIFDHDVHHGNGTQDIFYDRKDVMYQSFHLYPHYPGTGVLGEIGVGEGRGYTINAPLSHGNGNNAVSHLMDNVFLPIARQFKPDLIIISAGFDSHHADQLGGLNLTANFFGNMIKGFQEIQSKIVCTLEGGYNLNWIGKCIVSELGQMISCPKLFDDLAKESSNVELLIKDIKNGIDEYWNI